MWVGLNDIFVGRYSFYLFIDLLTNFQIQIQYYAIQGDSQPPNLYIVQRINNNQKLASVMLKLSTIASNIEKQKRSISSTIVAVVTDVTRPLYRKKQGNYIVMLKIVDQSLNDQQMFGVMSKDCTVYLLSKKKKDINFIKTVGQIVLLDKFMYTLWNGIKLQTKYLGTTQGLYTVQYQPNTQKIITKNKLAMTQLLDTSSSVVVERVKNLMLWRSTKLPSIYQPKLGINIVNSHCVMVEPFNMILMYEGKKQQEQLNQNAIDVQNQNQNQQQAQQKSKTIILKDINQNTYIVQQSQPQSYNFQTGDLVYIRGIATIGQSLQLILTQTGNILRFAYKINPSIMNYMAIYRDNQKFIAQKKQNQFTVISCECESNNIMYISQLMQLQDKYNHSSRKQDIDTRDTYFVKVVVINYQGILSLYHREFQILLNEEFYDTLQEEDKRQYKQYNKIGYVYQGFLGLIDRSNESKGKPFFVNLFTCDLNGNFISPEEFQHAEKAIGTQSQKHAKKHLLQVINKKLTKISELSSFDRPVTLALEPIRSEKLLFRLANTKII